MSCIVEFLVIVKHLVDVEFTVVVKCFLVGKSSFGPQVHVDYESMWMLNSLVVVSMWMFISCGFLVHLEVKCQYFVKCSFFELFVCGFLLRPTFSVRYLL